MRDREELVDLDYRLQITPSGNIATVEGADVIKQSIKAILSTVPGERVRNPEFGSPLYAMLFEPMSQFTVNAIKTAITRSIERFENRVGIRHVRVMPDYDNNMYNISIAYYNLTNGRTENFDASIRVLGG